MAPNRREESKKKSSLVKQQPHSQKISQRLNRQAQQLSFMGLAGAGRVVSAHSTLLATNDQLSLGAIACLDAFQGKPPNNEILCCIGL